VISDSSHSLANAASALSLSESASAPGFPAASNRDATPFGTGGTVAERHVWFAREVHSHDRQLKAFVRGTYPAVRDIEDVVQESYLRLWKAAAQEPIDSAKAFLFHVARRVALNFIRKQRNAPFDPFGDRVAARIVEEKPDAAEALLVQERIDLLADALMTLPPRCRDVTVLHKVKGLSHKEVAVQLGISERTVEAHVRTGVSRCHAYLSKLGLESLRRNET